MHAAIVRVQVKPEFLDVFIAATHANHKASVQEPGNIRFDVLQHPEDPARFVLYELYRSAEDAAAHKETDHYRRWRDAVAPWMAAPREGVIYNGLFPEES